MDRGGCYSSDVNPGHPGSKVNGNGLNLKNNNQNDICRDFLRNVCTRGNKCKFFHPKNKEDSNTLEKNHKDHPKESKDKILQDQIIFCLDYLSKEECKRSNCKFIHCSKDEQDKYKRSGYLPPRIREQIIQKGVAPDMSTRYGGKPMCKDFRKGECTRNNCRFRHITAMQHDLEMVQYMKNNLNEPNVVVGGGGQSVVSVFGRNHHEPYNFDNTHYGSSYNYVDFNSDSCPPMAKKPRRSEMTLADIEMVQQENMLLKQRVEELKKQVQDLGTTNEFLLEQNAHLRMGVKHSTASVVSVATAPPPTATQLSAALPPPNQPPLSLAIQPTISMSPAVVTAPACSLPAAVGPPPTLSLSMASLQQPPPATITMTPAAMAGSITAIEGAIPVQSMPNVTMSSLTPTEMTLSGAQPVSATSRQNQQPNGGQPAPSQVHVQETRIVSYPITSIRQAM